MSGEVRYEWRGEGIRGMSREGIRCISGEVMCEWRGKGIRGMSGEVRVSEV